MLQASFHYSTRSPFSAFTRPPPSIRANDLVSLGHGASQKMKREKRGQKELGPHISGSVSAVRPDLLSPLFLGNKKKNIWLVRIWQSSARLLSALAKLSATAYAYKGDIGPVICSLPVDTVSLHCTGLRLGWHSTAAAPAWLSQPWHRVQPSIGNQVVGSTPNGQL